MEKKTPGTDAHTNPNESPRHLVVLSQQAPVTGRIYKLHKDRIVFGTVVSADIQIQGEGVAPIHAVIEISTKADGSPSAMIFDIASDTGIFINGVKHVTAPVKTGDEITIGRYRLKFAVEDPSNLKLGSRVQQSFEGQKLVIDADEDLRPLLLQEAAGTVEIFDYRPASKTALEVVMSWSNSILDIEHFVDHPSVTLGADQNSDFAIPPILGPSAFHLATQSGEQYTLQLDSKMKGVIQRQGQLLTLDQVKSIAGANVLVLGKNDFAKISVGEIDFYLSYTAAPPLLKPRKLFERDPFFFKIMASSVGLTAALIATMLSIEVPKQIEVEELPERIATILYQPEKYQAKPEPKFVSKTEDQQEPKKQPEPQKTVKVDINPADAKNKPIPKTMVVADKQQKGGKAQKKQDQAKEGAGAKAKGQEGLRGSKNAAPNKENQLAAKRPSPQAGKGAGGGNSQVQDIGNVDVLKGAASTIQNILGNTAAKLGSGGSQLQGFGNFSTLGKGGAALSGDGKGGGGDAEGLGGLANKGRGGGRVGTGLGAAGQGSGIIGGSTRVELRTGGEGETVVMGAIDKAAIAAAIEAHRDEFRLCYEREINAENPNIGGTIKTSFVIGSSGRATQAGVESSTIKNTNVERCVVNVLKRIEFPKPVGGGVVQVGYPFKFASSAGGK